MRSSRTEAVLKNTGITLVCQVLHLVFNFINRTILTWQLGTEYLGINGLFSNVLMILSFAELGIGSTMVYRMYEPLASGDREKIAMYVLLYKRIYLAIIAVISIFGLAIIPFIKYIVHAPNVEESLILLYLLYLVDTIISYAFVYKKSILIADQKSYVVSVFTQGFSIVMNIIQCVTLMITHSFVWFFLVRIACDLLNNICCSAYAQKEYSYISTLAAPKIDREEKEKLRSDIKGLALNNIASVAFGGTDNIFISKFIGISYVGVLSNYTLIMSTVNTMMNSVFNSITASIGNLSIVEDSSETEKALYRMFFLNTGFYCYACVGMMLLLQEFVTKIWLSPEYYLSSAVIEICIVELFFRSVHYPIHTVRNALGLFSQYKVLFASAAVLNILLDFIWVRPLGIAGLILATLLCRGITYVIDIFVVYRLGFHSSPACYFKKLSQWSMLMVAEYILLHFLLQFIHTGGLLTFVEKIILISVIHVLSCYLFFRKSDEFLYFKEFLRRYVERKKT